ncbi:hypothetical protein MKW98_027221, partial [Papaver atlanticum]
MARKFFPPVFQQQRWVQFFEDDNPATRKSYVSLLAFSHRVLPTTKYTRSYMYLVTSLIHKNMVLQDICTNQQIIGVTSNFQPQSFGTKECSRETASKCSSSSQTLSLVIMMRKRGGLSQRSSGRVDPLHNSVPERSPISRQKPSTNVFTLGRARGGLSQSSGPTNGSCTRQKGQSPDVDQHTPSLSRSLCSPRQLPTGENAAGQPHEEDQLSSPSISRSRCNSLPNNLGLDTRQRHCRHPSQGKSNSHDQSNQGDEVATRRPYNRRENSPLLTACYFKDVPEENVKRVVTLVMDHIKLVPDDALTEKLQWRTRPRTALTWRTRKLCAPCSIWRNFRAKKSQVLKHSNGPTIFSQSMHSRALNGEPTDPITMFDVTHKFKKSTDPTCET